MIKFQSMKTLIIDNFDSFTYNLYQYVAELDGNPIVYRNNAISLKDIGCGGYTHIIISPGPGRPEKKKDFGICGSVIKKFAGRIPILGVCLGHQGIIHAFGGKIIRAKTPMHGKRSIILVKNSDALFKGLPEKIEGMRYHSLIAEKCSLPEDLKITAQTKQDKIIMGVAHKSFPLFGVQFHPESIGTKFGKKILENFLKIRARPAPLRCRTPLRCRALLWCRVRSSDLSEKQAEVILYQMAKGKMPEKKMVEILTKLADKGESVSEIVGMARGMRKRLVRVPGRKRKFIGDEFPLMDTCGTGGSGLKRMNISTTAAFVLAACGVRIAKHGNRAASGRCGGFDLLEALGINIMLPPQDVAQSIREIGIGFIFAPMFHPAMKNIGPVRKKLGRRTIFNLLGPLTNPARVNYHLLGVTTPETAEKMIEAMKGLNYTHAMIACGEDGLDDITLNGKTKIYELDRGRVRSFEFAPEDVGMKCVKNFKEIAGGGTKQNAKIFIELLQGRGKRALQNLLLLNTAFALVAREIVPTVSEGISLARRVIAGGDAYKKFLEYKRFSNQCRRFHKAICGKKKIKIIAEIKRASPSFGKFPQHGIAKMVKIYEKGGAAALSCVTEPKLFNGSIKLLKKMKAVTERHGGKSLPILRKDFIRSTAQIDETAEAGANAILLIARNLSKSQLKKLIAHAHKLNLDAVVEIHTQQDLKKLKKLAGIIVGINNRNLKNYKTNVMHARALLNKIDPHETIIVESGFKNARDLAKYRGKADAALIGTTLLTSKHPLKLLRSLC